MSVPTPITFLFETDSLEHASPATVSRLAVILVSDLTEKQQIAQVSRTNEQVARLVPLLPASLKDHLEEITTHMEIAAAGDRQDPV